MQAAASRLRVGPGLVPAAFNVEIEADDEEEYHRQFRAVCRLARLSAVPVITVRPAAATVPLDAEAARLGKLVRLADADGVLVCAATVAGTHAGTPRDAVRLCEKAPGLCLTLDPSHYTAGPHQGHNYDEVFPYVRHVHLRDTGRGPNQFQVKVGQGEIEYGRILAQLARCRYGLALAVDIRDIPDAPFPMEPRGAEAEVPPGKPGLIPYPRGQALASLLSGTRKHETGLGLPGVAGRPRGLAALLHAGRQASGEARAVDGLQRQGIA